MIRFKNRKICNNKIAFNFYCARPELVEGYPRALEEILQQVQDERREYRVNKGNYRCGFTLVEVILSLAITSLVLTPIFILYGTIMERVNRGSIAFDMILYCKQLLIQARQKQEPDAQEFTLDKSINDFNATVRYSLEKSLDQKSPFASLPGLHREMVVVSWTEYGQKKQEQLVTFVYKKPEQKKS